MLRQMIVEKDKIDDATCRLGRGSGTQKMRRIYIRFNFTVWDVIARGFVRASGVLHRNASS